MCPVISGSGVADDLLADHRAAAVGADQGRALHAGRRSRVCTSTEEPPASKPDDLAVGAQLDQLRQGLAAVEQRAVDVGAVGHRVGVAEALGEAPVERDVDHLLAAHAVEHQHALDEHRLLLHQGADAEGVERVPGVGRDLDAGADLAELLRLLEHHRAEALAGEGEGGGEAADAAAGDQDRAGVAGVISILSPARGAGRQASRHKPALARRAFRHHVEHLQELGVAGRGFSRQPGFDFCRRNLQQSCQMSNPAHIHASRAALFGCRRCRDRVARGAAYHR